MFGTGTIVELTSKSSGNAHDRPLGIFDPFMRRTLPVLAASPPLDFDPP
jgi:hypothetical protein